MRFAATQEASSCGIKLLKDERGVIAIIYALSLVPLIDVIALAVDFGFISSRNRNSIWLQMQDVNSVAGPIDVSRCTNLKSMGYTIYVVCTAYYPLMHYWYSTNNVNDFSGGGNSVTSKLKSCASSTSDYFEASDTTTLTAALKTILTKAEQLLSAAFQI